LALEFAALAIQEADPGNALELVLEAVAQNGMALEFAGALVADREVALTAVRQNGMALGFAWEALCADREVVSEAVKQAKGAIAYASEELQKDPAIAEGLSAKHFKPPDNSHLIIHKKGSYVNVRGTKFDEYAWLEDGAAVIEHKYQYLHPCFP